MESDVKGCSTCPIGEENYENYHTGTGRRRKKNVQYDYRHTNGKLFATCAPTLEIARERRDKWMEENGYTL